MLGKVKALKNAVDFSSRQQIVDAGGGLCGYSITPCQMYPDLVSRINGSEPLEGITPTITERLLWNKKIAR
jgi:hypothetical protein